MNIFCTYIIPCCLIFVLLVLIYWMIKLDKFEDYKYVMRQYWKWLKQIGNDIENRFVERDARDNASQQTSEMSVIDLEKNKELNDVLTSQDLKRKNSIKLNHNLNDKKRKNSIDYTILVNSLSTQNHPGLSHPPNEVQNQSIHQKISPVIPSNNHLGIGSLHPHSHSKTLFLSPGINHQQVNEPERTGLRHSTDYFKLYLNYRQKSKTELISMKNARSNQDLQKGVSFRNLCEINGVKTIRDLIKEGL